MKDLVLLVADKNAQFALRGALGRPEALGVHSIEHEFRVHPGRDGGARTNGADLLIGERARFSHALLVFDFEGSGAENRDLLELEAETDVRLQAHWGANAKCIVIAPEVDIWLWGAENAMTAALHWPGSAVGIRDWLREKGYQFDDADKPLRPKEALEALMLSRRIPRSSALYERVTKQISLRRCQDAAFIRLRTQLREWFPPAPR